MYLASCHGLVGEIDRFLMALAACHENHKASGISYALTVDVERLLVVAAAVVVMQLPRCWEC